MTPFGDLLRHARRRAGLSQHELAARAALSARAVGNLERGARTRPRKHTVTQLLRALDLTGPDADALVAAAQGGRATALPVVGRAEHRAAIAEVLRAPEPSMILLTGAPGVGKTRLLDEAAGLASGPVHRHRCTGDRACWAAAPAPGVLLLDDLHRADRPAWAMITTRLRDRTAPVRIIAAARSDPAPLPDDTRLRATGLLRVVHVDPLCERSSRALLLATGHDLDPLVQRQVIMLAGGRPAWLLAFAEGVAAGEPPLGPDGPPLPVLHAVRAVLADLSPSARQLLRLAALAVPPWPSAVLAEAAGRDHAVVREHLADACRTGLLRGDADGHRFTDDLVRLVLGGELGPGARAASHQALADAFARVRPASAGYHRARGELS